ncbi:MAG: hypothetical protein KJ630_15655 [Proteobacteria bacterium]|nr:hypothetical protein [Pseudomonadota bacterium]
MPKKVRISPPTHHHTMQKAFIILLCCIALFFSSLFSRAESSEPEKLSGAERALVEKPSGPVEMLASLLELQKNLKEQIQLSQKKLKASTSEAEKAALEKEISGLDKQLSESKNDFERIATGVEPTLFAEKKPQTFSWKEEMASLLEPAIKELKRFTMKARQKTDLKDKITELELLSATAGQAVSHLQKTIEETAEKQVQAQVKALQPEWINVEKRLRNKLELSKSELRQLESQEVSFVESSKDSLRTFFRDRGFYLILAVLTFVAILLTFRLLYRVATALSIRFTKQPEERSLQMRLLYIIFQVLSVIFAVVGLFFVLYLAEDWFLLSMAIIFFLGLAWTIRQGLPRLWQQGRLMLNIGSVRENERLILHGVPWKVASINVFCKLVNPSLDAELRVPIENLIGLVSRPWHPEEPWFPCKKGDWVVVGGNARGKVVSLSHEQVELIERGGRRIFYTTEAFLGACPANLSRNFRLRVIFGISYNLQEKATAEIPAMLKDYLNLRMEEEDYLDKCLSLQVEFMQASASSLDLLILGDFDGRVADISKRIERAIQKWCVECCTKNNWEIPFPQLTVHRPAGGQG